MATDLVHTTKVLKTVTSLRFANRHLFTIEPTAAWLSRSKLTPTDRKQLVAIVGLYGEKPAITLERALTTAPAELFTGGLDGFAECEIEWFDVLDQDAVLQFQLWLYYGDAGVLLRAGTTTAVAQVNNSSFYGSERGLDEATGERLAMLLRKAKKVTVNLHPKSGLATTGF